MPDSNGVTKADLAALQRRLVTRFEEMRDYIDERTRDVETGLLRISREASV